ncbi:MAG: serine/threonine protein kinase [Polyangiaceae bacterium]|nr:serine/threonine protein kinase [Polyangiaceae bacterium]
MLSQAVIEKAEARVGTTLCNKWHLDRVIGVGGMAAVYEATHRNRNRVAIKLLHPQWSLDENTRRRFLREGYLANTIRHDGAVRVLDDYMGEDGTAFLVMELLVGETLEQRVNRKGGVLENRDALLLTQKILDVVASAHDQGIVHRDIKPDNIFLTTSGMVKILDFGIARMNQGDEHGGTQFGSFMGTPAFCAPEQARARWDDVDERTDIYSVGATLFSLLSGRHVHESESSSEQLALAISATAPSLSSCLSEVPRELVELVDTALSYEPDERFQSSRAMHAAIERILPLLPAPHDTPSDIPPRSELPLLYEEPQLPESRTWGTPQLRFVFSVAIVAVVASVLIFFSAYSSQSSREAQPTQAEDAQRLVRAAQPSIGAAPAGEREENEEEPQLEPSTVLDREQKLPVSEELSASDKKQEPASKSAVRLKSTSSKETLKEPSAAPAAVDTSAKSNQGELLRPKNPSGGFATAPSSSALKEKSSAGQSSQSVPLPPPPPPPATPSDEPSDEPSMNDLFDQRH